MNNYNPNNITKSKVIEKKIFIKDLAPQIWDLALQIINKSVAKGLYLDK